MSKRMEQSRKHGAFDPRYVSRPSPLPSPEALLQRRLPAVRKGAGIRAVATPAPIRIGGVS